MNKTISKLSTILLSSSTLLVSCGEVVAKETDTSRESSFVSFFEQTSSSKLEPKEPSKTDDRDYVKWRQS